MSTFANKERTLRLTLKLMQFVVSIYLIFSLYNTGPHWILLIACLAVPVYGIYLMAKSPDRTLKHPLPYIRYKALARTRSWLRVDMVISLTMACVCFGFSAILFFGYFKINSATSFYLQSATASLVLCILYLANTLMTMRQMQMGQIDFIIDNEKQLFSTSESRRSPLAINTDFGSDIPGLGTMQQGKRFSLNQRTPSMVLLERLQMEIAKSQVVNNSSETHKTSMESNRTQKSAPDSRWAISATKDILYKSTENELYNEVNHERKNTRGSLLVTRTDEIRAPDMYSEHHVGEPANHSQTNNPEYAEISAHRERYASQHIMSGPVSPYKPPSQPYNRRPVPINRSAQFSPTEHRMPEINNHPSEYTSNSANRHYSVAEHREQISIETEISPKTSDAGPSSILKKPSTTVYPPPLPHPTSAEDHLNKSSSSSSINHNSATYSSEFSDGAARDELYNQVSDKMYSYREIATSGYTRNNTLPSDIYATTYSAKSDMPTFSTLSYEREPKTYRAIVARVSSVESGDGYQNNANINDSSLHKEETHVNVGTFIPPEPLTPIAISIDSGREHQMQKVNASVKHAGTKLKDKIETHRRESEEFKNQELASARYPESMDITEEISFLFIKTTDF
ncbi:hypothetical protein Ddc_03017 [Ditylenchus destructor]|nr:hypothetical protein Ddc_03017 [Ditylenchus destructor]